MKNKILLVGITILIIGGIGGYFITNNRQTAAENTQTDVVTTPSGMHRMQDGSMMTNTDTASNKEMVDHGSMTVQSERAFISAMIPHHEEAVATAKEVLSRGGSTDAIRTLATNIITAQEKEIADMKSWYQDWYGMPYTPTNSYQPMMRNLAPLSGLELDKAFLADMVMHHRGAITMAESVQPHIEHEEIKHLTAAISSTQSEEIILMQSLLRDL